MIACTVYFQHVAVNRDPLLVSSHMASILKANP
jgi:hypothetical protein